MDFKHITFFIDLTVDKFDELEEIVKTRYGIEEYMISHEQFNEKQEEKPHYHFIIYTTEKNFTNLLQYLVKYYNLKNVSGNRGGRRKYGRLKAPIQDLNKLKIYCAKDGNIRSSYSPDILDELYRQSFKKTNKMLKQKCLEYVESTISSGYSFIGFEEIRMKVIEFCLIEKIHIRKTLIDSYVIYIGQHSEYNTLKLDSSEIYRNLYTIFND